MKISHTESVDFAPCSNLPELPHFSDLHCSPREAFYQNGMFIPFLGDHGGIRSNFHGVLGMQVLTSIEEFNLGIGGAHLERSKTVHQ